MTRRGWSFVALLLFALMLLVLLLLVLLLFELGFRVGFAIIVVFAVGAGAVVVDGRCCVNFSGRLM